MAAMLKPNNVVDVIKLYPTGTEATRYTASVLDEAMPNPWVAVQATWVMKRVDAHGLVFEPGDKLIEYFSPDHWYDAFRVESPDGDIRGWYGNVTYPTKFALNCITWHDLYLDVIKLADGSVQLCDEHELVESKLSVTDPQLHRTVIENAAILMALAVEGSFPFHCPATSFR